MVKGLLEDWNSRQQSLLSRFYFTRPQEFRIWLVYYLKVHMSLIGCFRASIKSILYLSKNANMHSWPLLFTESEPYCIHLHCICFIISWPQKLKLYICWHLTAPLYLRVCWHIHYKPSLWEVYNLVVLLLLQAQMPHFHPSTNSCTGFHLNQFGHSLFFERRSWGMEGIITFNFGFRNILVRLYNERKMALLLPFFGRHLTLPWMCQSY